MEDEDLGVKHFGKPTKYKPIQTVMDPRYVPVQYEKNPPHEIWDKKLGNLNQDNTLAFILSGGPVIRQGFNLSKKAPSVIEKVLKKGRDLAVKFGDDAVNIISSSGGSK